MRALTTVVLFALLVPLFAQAPAKATRLGDVARQLTEQDVIELERALPGGEKPWLLIGEPGRAPGLNVAAFLQPKISTSEVRRGAVTMVRRELNASAWKALDRIDYDEQIGHSDSYAQVALPDRGFDQMQGDQDLNRPFFVTGDFKDSELVSLAKYIRSRSVRPILSVVRQQDKTVHVWVREKATAWQWLRLEQGHTWKLLSTSQISD
jgi:hypothetical protein